MNGNQDEAPGSEHARNANDGAETWRESGEPRTDRHAQRAQRPTPGKVTRASKLPGRRSLAVQREATTTGTGPARRTARSLWELTTDPWMDAAHRGLTALAEPSSDAVQARGNAEAEAPASVTAVQLSPEAGDTRAGAGQVHARDGRATSVSEITGPVADAGTPELTPYQGASVGQPGKISAPAEQYEHARTAGVNVRARPDGALPAIGAVRYDTTVQVQALDTTGAFYFVLAPASGVTGWVNRDFVALGMPDPGATLHHVTESNLTAILEAHYVAPGRWKLATGNDYTTLAAAVVTANQGRTGVQIDASSYGEYKDENPLRAGVDPTGENFALYHAVKVFAGQNIWLPSPAYVRMLQGAGVIGARPGWVNAAVDVGKGIAGFHAGLVAGVFGSLWDTLAGVWELGKTVVSTIARAIEGSLFTDLQALYDELRDLSWQKAQAMVASVVTMARTAVGDFVAQWNHPDVYRQWFFRGQLAGAVALEVVLALISGGGSLGAKLLAKIGQYAPRLMRALNKLLRFADELDFTRRRKRGGHGSDGDAGAPERDRDMNEADRDFHQTLALARVITEGHDVRDTPVDELLLQLNTTLAAKSRAVKGYRASPHKTKPGHHRIVQFSKEAEVDGDYSGKGTERRTRPKGRYDVADWTDGTRIDALIRSHGKRHQGRFPDRSTGGGREILFRQGQDGNVTAYMVYDDGGLPVKRVDVDPVSAPHAGIAPPHVVDYVDDVAPNGRPYRQPGATRVANLEEYADLRSDL